MLLLACKSVARLLGSGGARPKELNGRRLRGELRLITRQKPRLGQVVILGRFVNGAPPKPLIAPDQFLPNRHDR